MLNYVSKSGTEDGEYIRYKTIIHTTSSPATACAVLNFVCALSKSQSPWMGEDIFCVQLKAHFENIGAFDRAEQVQLTISADKEKKDI